MTIPQIVVSFLDPCMGGGQFVQAVEQRLRSYGHSDKNIAKRVYGIENSRLRINYAINKHGLVGQYRYCEDYLEYDEKMKFDVVIENPPFNGDDTSRDGKNHRGQGENLAKKFALKAIDLSKRHILFIMPYGHRTYSTRLAKQYKSNGLYRIDSHKEHFKDVSTNPCIFYFDKTKVVFDVEDNYYTHDIEIPRENISCLFRNQPGTLNRIDYEHTLTDKGKYKVVVTTSVVRYTDDEDLVRRMKDKTRGNWRVVFNCTTSVGQFGKIIIAEPETVLSKSVHCLLLSTKEEAIEMKKYLESDKATNILKEVKTINACNSKKFLQYIPMPTSTKHQKRH